jgi:hypothetical protein
MMSPSKAVGSYPTFSSFLCQRLSSYFLWHSLLLQHTFQHWLKYPRLSRGALLCTVRTFLLPPWRKAIARFAANGKFTFKMWISIQKISPWRHNQIGGRTDLQMSLLPCEVLTIHVYRLLICRYQHHV